MRFCPLQKMGCLLGCLLLLTTTAQPERRRRRVDARRGGKTLVRRQENNSAFDARRDARLKRRWYACDDASGQAYGAAWLAHRDAVLAQPMPVRRGVKGTQLICIWRTLAEDAELCECLASATGYSSTLAEENSTSRVP